MSRAFDLLLVEDNPGDVRLVEKVLANDPRVRLHVARSGAEALGFLRDGDRPPPHLVILDLNLPAMDGRELLAEMKADPALQPIPVVVLTGSAAQDDVNRCYALQANCYVIKPRGWTEFHQVISAVKRFWLETATLPNR